MERDDSHHLSSPDGLAEPSLGPPCELGVCPAYDTSHIGHEVREEGGVEGLPEWIDTELVEDVLTTGFFSRRTEVGTLEDDGLFCPTLHREGPWSDSLSWKRELPSPRRERANLVQLGILEHSVRPCSQARCGMVGSPAG